MKALRLSLYLFLSVVSFAGLVSSSPITMQQANETTDSCDAQDSIGQAGVHNTCSFTIFIQSVAGQEIGPVITLGPGMLHLEEFHDGPNGSGVAIKITDNSEDWSTPMLLEYTPNFELDMVFYDMSVSVGGDGQGDGGIGTTYQLTPSTIDPATSCIPVTYGNSYVHLGEDDFETKSCPLSTTITLQVCYSVVD